MKTEVSIPDLGLLAVTRGLLGAGIGLLVAHRLSESQRRPLGWTLFAIGLATTVPLAIAVFGGATVARARPLAKVRGNRRTSTRVTAARPATRH